MSNPLLIKLGAKAAWQELQEAYGLLYCITEDGQKPDLKKAEEHLTDTRAEGL